MRLNRQHKQAILEAALDTKFRAKYEAYQEQIQGLVHQIYTTVYEEEITIAKKLPRSWQQRVTQTKLIVFSEDSRSSFTFQRPRYDMLEPALRARRFAHPQKRSSYDHTKISFPCNRSEPCWTRFSHEVEVCISVDHPCVKSLMAVEKNLRELISQAVEMFKQIERVFLTCQSLKTLTEAVPELADLLPARMKEEARGKGKALTAPETVESLRRKLREGK